MNIVGTVLDSALLAGGIVVGTVLITFVRHPNATTTESYRNGFAAALIAAVSVVLYQAFIIRNWAAVVETLGVLFAASLAFVVSQYR